MDNKHRHSFAVIVSHHVHWQQWVSDKVYGTHTKDVRVDRFTLRDIEYKKIQYISDTRGWKFDGIIEHELAKDNPVYYEIMKIIECTIN